MSGGTWISQNKVRPGAYINFKSKGKETVILGERGIVTLPLILPWGPEKKVIEINASDKLFDVIGIDIMDSSAKLIRETFKRANTLLMYRLNVGEKASAKLENLTITAKYSGEKGNDITVVIQNNIDASNEFDVITIFNGKQVDKQIVKTIDDLKSNDYVEFKGKGELQTTAGLLLEGGTNGDITNQDYSDYLTAIELYDFNTMGITSKDETIKAVAANFIKRLREQEGKKVQVVLENYPQADYEGVISVKNGVVLEDETITANQAVTFVAGATAGANANTSNTHTTYDGAIDVNERYTNKQIEEALKNGEIVFTVNNNKVVIEQDINTFKSFSKEKDNSFRKNRVLRTLDSINNDIKSLWETRYIGKGSNNADGRNLFKKDIIKLLEAYQGMNAVENVSSKDIEVLQGEDKDEVAAEIKVQPVDSPEKLYMNVEVQ